MKKTAQGFTLVELLVVIAIIGVLAAVVVLVLNPVELTRESRDAVRLTDLATMQQAINASVQANTADTGYTLYCESGVNSGICTHDSYQYSTTDQTVKRGIDGTGWVAIKLNTQNVVNLPVLPIDPSNGATYKYVYRGKDTGYKIMAKMESLKHAGKMTTDGGSATDSETYYEVGTALGL